MANWMNVLRRSVHLNFRNLLFLSVSVLTFIFLSAVSYQFYSSSTRLMVNKSEEINNNTLSQLNKTLESNFLQMEKIAKIVSSSSTLIDNIKQLEQSPLVNRIQTRSNIDNMLLKFQGFNPFISDIYVFSDDSIFHVGRTTANTINQELQTKDIYRYLSSRQSPGTSGTPLFLEPDTTVYPQAMNKSLKNNGYHYLFGSLLMEKGNSTAIGTVLLVVDDQIFGTLLNQNPKLLLLDNTDKIIWKGNEVSPADVDAVNQYLSKDKVNLTKRYQSRLEVLYKIQSEFDNMKLVYIQKSTDVTNRIDLLKTYLLVVYVITILLSLYFSRFLSKKIARPIRRLLTSVNRYRNADKAPYSYVKQFPRVTLRENIMYFIIVMTLVPILLFSVLSYFYTYRVVEDYLTEINKATFEQVSNNLDHYFENKEKVIFNIAYDSNIQEGLSGSPFASPVNYVELINDYLLLDTGRDDIFIYNPDKKIVFTNNSNTANTTVDKADFDRIDQSGDAFTWINTKKDDYNRYLFNYMIKINNVTKFNPIGYIQSQISELELENIYKLLVNADSNYFIVDKNNTIVSDLEQTNIHTILNLNPDENFVFKKAIKETPWTIVGAYNYSNMKQEMKQILYQQIYTIIIIFLIIIFIAYFLSLKITSSLRRMNELLGMISIDHMDFDFPPNMQIHEISELAYSFNEMVQRIESLIDELLIATRKQVDLEHKKRNAELLALQSQINPHFLYNTFDNIKWLIKGGDKENSLQMVDSLSSLLRYSSRSDNLIATIAEEIQHVHSYMEIMEIRFSEQIALHMDSSESFLSYPIIKLILQPIVENAIHHGISPKQQGGIIRIAFFEAPDKIIIKVSDDGVGLARERVDELNTNLNKGGYPERIGLYNVQTRIRLFFGQEYGLRIKSRLGKGTIVEIHLPKTFELPK